MNKVKLFLLVFTVFLILGVLLVSAVPTLRNGFLQAFSGSLRDTASLISDQGPSVYDDTPSRNLPDRPSVPNREGSSRGEENVTNGSESGESEEPDRVKGNLELHVIGTTGNAILIREGSTTVLLDGSSKSGAGDVVKYLKDHGIDSLTYLVATNYHLTAIGGIPTILEEIPVTYLVLARNVDTDERGHELLSYLKSKNLVWISPHKEYVDLDLGFGSKSTLRLVRTHHEGSFLTVLMNNFNQFVVSGDITLVEEPALKYLPLKADYYFISARSDIYSIPEGVLDTINPKNLVIGADADNHFVKAVEDKVKGRDIRLLKVYPNSSLVMDSNGLADDSSIHLVTSGVDVVTLSTSDSSPSDNGLSQEDTAFGGMDESANETSEGLEDSVNSEVED